MKIVLGSLSNRKKRSLENVISQYYSVNEFEVITYKSSSKVPETPWDRETFDGAYNRALDCKVNIHEADYYIGVESGLVERYGHIYEEAWCCVLTKTTEVFGYSSGLKVPDFILSEMDRLKIEHNKVMKILDDKELRVGNDDTWGTYSNNLIIRDVSLEEAIRNAFIQVFATNESYFKK